MRRHLQWEREGRTLEVPSTGQRVYCGQIGQRNLELADGSFAPFVWSDDARTLCYGDVEACFVRDAIEFRRAGVLQARTRPRLQRRTARGWVDDDEARVRVERLADEDELGAIASARVALVLESPRATARHVLVAGGWSRARGDTELRAHLPGEYRVVVDHDLGGAPVAVDTSVGAAGYISALGWRVAWTAEEDRERAVRVTDIGISIEMPRLRRARGQRRPAEQRISPDTYGPVVNAGGDDDGLSRPDANGGVNYKPDGLTGFGSQYDNALFVDDNSADSDRCVHWRFASVNLGGTPTSIDAGTQLVLDRTGLDRGTGGGGVIRFRCQASNTPATGSASTDTTTGRPCLRTYNTAFSEATFPTSGEDDVDVTPSLVTAIGGLATAGYSYTGSAAHAIMVLAGANTAWGITAVSYRAIGFDVSHATGAPASLTVVYTPGAGGSPITGTLNVSLAAATLASTGTVVTPPGGNLNVVLADATLAGTGTVTGEGTPTTFEVGIGTAEQELNAVSHGGPFTKTTPSTDVTIASVSGNILTAAAAHGMKRGDGPYRFATTGTLPGGLAVDTDYYVCEIGPTTFAVATTGANAIANNEVVLSDAGTGTHTLVRTVDTQPTGSLFLVVVERGVWDAAPSEAPTDNYGNLYTLLGTTHEYQGFAGSKTGVYYSFGNGGPNHTWSIQGADFDEITVSAIEIKGAKHLPTHSHVERAIGSATIVSAPVTVTASAILVAICCGNGPVGTDKTYSVEAGWTKKTAASREADMSPNGYIQVAVATRQVTPGTYTVSWSHANNDGGQLYLVAVQEHLGTSGELTAALADATVDAAAGSRVSGNLAKTLDGATVASAGASRVEGALGTTLDAATAASAGATRVAGAGAVSATATLAAAGSAPVAGSLATALQPATLVAAGVVTSPDAITGTLDVVLEPAALSATATGTVTGTLATTTDDAALAAAGGVRVSAALDATLADAALFATGGGQVARTGALDVTLAAVDVVGQASASVAGGLSAVLGGTCTATGRVAIAGAGVVVLEDARLTAGSEDQTAPDDVSTVVSLITDAATVSLAEVVDYATVPSR